jgi:hypothetical protein
MRAGGVGANEKTEVPEELELEERELHRECLETLERGDVDLAGMAI